MKKFYKLVSRWHSGFGSELCIFSFTLTRYDSDTVVVVLLFYVHGKHLRSCRDGQLT